MTQSKPGRILVTGATGYVGGRLVPRLLDAGYQVRAVSRSLEKLQNRHWANHPRVELMACNLDNPAQLLDAVTDIDAAYYLIHSMGRNHMDFAEADRRAAENMIAAASKKKLRRILYLSGLGEGHSELSKHLQSRTEVGHILQSGDAAVTILRAAMILGSGSASFEILRYLVDRLPVMITPKWVNTPCQPIAIRNVLDYLIGCLENEQTSGRVLDIGGPDILTYRKLMEMYAEEAGLRKPFIIPVPIFSPKLSSYWIHLITPAPASIAMPLAEGLKNPVICHDHRIREILPIQLLSSRDAIRRALDHQRQQMIETHWSDAGMIPPAEYHYPGDPDWTGGTVFTDKRRIILRSSPGALWEPIIRIGGQTGWYFGNWLWQLRGLMDVFFGGIGLRRGRRDPASLKAGDALDFWRVVTLQPESRLLLLAEMKVPGEAYLEFRLKRLTNQGGEPQTELIQLARFAPQGLIGIVYWWLVYPLHHFVFNGMLLGIAKASQQPILSGPERTL